MTSWKENRAAGRCLLEQVGLRLAQVFPLDREAHRDALAADGLDAHAPTDRFGNDPYVAFTASRSAGVGGDDARIRRPTGFGGGRFHEADDNVSSIRSANPRVKP